MTDSTTFDALATQLAGFATRDEPLAPLTTYRLGGPAAVLARPASIGDLERIAEALSEAPEPLPLLIVGRGSNLLVADQGFAGLVVSTAELGEQIEFDDVEMRCAPNVLLPVAARRSAAQSLTGFEWAVGVPGSIGGAVRMNAGGHGSDTASSLRCVDLFDLRSGRLAKLTADRLGLRFRGSDVADHELVAGAVIQLAPGDRSVSEHEISEIVRWRREHQPGGQNAGSVFVNPVPGEVTAGALIDTAGLRGVRIGGAIVSPKHANFIQAEPGATADDVRALIRLVRARVADETGYVLRSEVRQVGFDDPAEPGQTENVGVCW